MARDPFRLSASVGGLNLTRRGIADAVDGPATEAMLRDHGDRVRDRARDNARAVSDRLADALWSEPGRDTDGAFVDVGYNRTRPGWVLWFHEVGTIRHPATPHLRPALTG